jgi:hypothetical protein
MRTTYNILVQSRKCPHARGAKVSGSKTELEAAFICIRCVSVLPRPLKMTSSMFEHVFSFNILQGAVNSV